jgi:Protein of unknown function (DUF2971)
LKRNIRRYTNVTVLLDMLVNTRLSLINPTLWDDLNDARLIEAYKVMAGFKFVGAVCLTDSQETYHHWKLFADGMSGVCIEFKTEELKRYILPQAGIKMKDVRYLKVDDIKSSNSIHLPDLPFSKRIAFSAEKEVRIIYETSDNIDIFHLSIDTSCIKRIITSPLMPENIHHSLRSAIQCIDNCSNIPVDRSHLFDSKIWQKRWDAQMRRLKGI